MPEVAPHTSDAMGAWQAWIDQAGPFYVTAMPLTVKHHPESFYVVLEINELKHGDLMLTMQSTHINIGRYACVVDPARRRQALRATDTSTISNPRPRQDLQQPCRWINCRSPRGLKLTHRSSCLRASDG